MTFKCLEKCGQCCGIVPLSKEVVTKHFYKLQAEVIEKKDIGDEVALITEDGLCAFLNRDIKTCEIYEDRPNICKIFGTGIDENGQENVLLYCQYFKPNGNEWSEAKRKHLARRVRQVLDAVMREGEKRFGGEYNQQDKAKQD